MGRFTMAKLLAEMQTKHTAGSVQTTTGHSEKLCTTGSTGLDHEKNESMVRDSISTMHYKRILRDFLPSREYGAG